jgi:RNA polymerase sigma-70 factor (ECF subfamily)
MTTEDDDLARRVGERDPEALAAFLEGQRARLVGFLRSIMSSRLLAVVEPDDLVQEVAAAALAGLATAPLDRYEPLEWLQELCRRRAVDAHRFHFGAQRRDAGRVQSMHAAGDDAGGGFEAFLAASITSPSAAFSRDVRVGRLQQAVSGLSEEARAAVQMRYAEGLPTKEIAARLGKTDVAIRVLLSRSVRVLEKELQDVRPSER